MQIVRVRLERIVSSINRSTRRGRFAIVTVERGWFVGRLDLEVVNRIGLDRVEVDQIDLLVVRYYTWYARQASWFFLVRFLTRMPTKNKQKLNLHES